MSLSTQWELKIRFEDEDGVEHDASNHQNLPSFTETHSTKEECEREGIRVLIDLIDQNDQSKYFASICPVLKKQKIDRKEIEWFRYRIDRLEEIENQQFDPEP